MINLTLDTCYTEKRKLCYWRWVLKWETAQICSQSSFWESGAGPQPLRQIALCISISLLFARLPGVVAAFGLSLSGGDFLSMLTYWTATLLLLVSAEPHEDHFIICCKRCGQRASRAYKNTFSCPRCEQLGFRSSANTLKAKQTPPVTGPTFSWQSRLPEKWRKPAELFLRTILKDEREDNANKHETKK